MKIDKSEQWLLNGKCNECRRRDYCGKTCTAYKKRFTMEIKQFIAEKMFEKLQGRK